MLRKYHNLEGLKPFATADTGLWSRQAWRWLHARAGLVIDVSYMFYSGKIQ
jgi:hypothetical protein